MGSNEDWGWATPKAQSAHDTFIQTTKPMAYAAPKMREWLSERGLDIPTMTRLGARVQGDNIIGYAFPDGIKWRNIHIDRRWSDEGIKWDHAKIVPAWSPIARAPGQPHIVVVTEGETDGATVSQECGGVDVAILPAGARHVPKNTVAQLRGYDRIILALDNDDAGREGTKALQAVLPNAEVVRIPDNYKDLNEWYVADRDGFNPLNAVTPPERHVFSVRELIEADLGSFEDNHYFSDGILPVRGQCVLHGGFKSLKSFMMLDMIRALATGSTFAGQYTYLRDEPIKCLLFQFEVPPFDFQQRIVSTLGGLGHGDRGLVMDNVFVHNLANNEWSRLKADPAMPEIITTLAKEVGADAVFFDPVQRMTGKADINSAAEMDLVLGAFEALQHAGLTVVYAHHNNKTGNDKSTSAYSMSGTQRFGADQDSICSLFRSKACIVDDNPQQIKQRNFAWTLRNGAARAGSIEVWPDPANTQLVKVLFGPPIVSATNDDDEEF